MQNQTVTMDGSLTAVDGEVFAADQFSCNAQLSHLFPDVFHKKHFITRTGYQLSVNCGVGLNRACLRSPHAHSTSGYIELLSSQAGCGRLGKCCWHTHYQLSLIHISEP